MERLKVSRTEEPLHLLSSISIRKRKQTKKGGEEPWDSPYISEPHRHAASGPC